MSWSLVRVVDLILEIRLSFVYLKLGTSQILELYGIWKASLFTLLILMPVLAGPFCLFSWHSYCRTQYVSSVTFRLTFNCHHRTEEQQPQSLKLRFHVWAVF